MDITGMVGNVDQLVSCIRQEIFDETKCTASAGIGPNKLIAKFATTKAKPNGQQRIEDSQIYSILNETDISHMPGQQFVIE